MSRAAKPAMVRAPSAPVRGRSPPSLLPEALVLAPALAEAFEPAEAFDWLEELAEDSESEEAPALADAA